MCYSYSVPFAPLIQLKGLLTLQCYLLFYFINDQNSLDQKQYTNITWILGVLA